MEIDEFLVQNASQLTMYGIEKLRQDINEGEYCVFFRNNHFSVIHKHNSQLYLLVTDQGYLSQKGIMWESLDRVQGGSHFYSPSFGPPEHEEAELHQADLTASYVCKSF